MRKFSTISKVVTSLILGGALSASVVSNCYAADFKAIPSNLNNKWEYIIQNLGESLSTEEGIRYEINDDGKTVKIVGYNETDPNAKKDVVIPDKIDGKDVTSIHEYAFTNMNITSIIIPNSVTVIEDGAFSACKELKSVKLPENIVSINKYTFSKCESLKEVVIPAKVTSIGTQAFFECKGLESITLPNGLNSIGDSAFCTCQSLKKIDFPSSVKNIGDLAFWKCSSIQEVRLPKELTTLGMSVFEECTSLKKAVISEKLTKLANGIFKACYALNEIIIPSSVTEIGNIFIEEDGRVAKNVTITCTSGSKAQEFAKKEEIKLNLDNTSPKLQMHVSCNDIENPVFNAEITADEEIREIEGWTLSSDHKTLTRTYTEKPNEIVKGIDLVGNESEIHVRLRGNGDINKDGKRTATDLLLLKRKIVGLSELTSSDKIKGDLNGDNKITATDLLQLKKIIVGLV